MNPETPLARAEVVALFRLLTDLAEQAGEDRLVHGGVIDVAPRLLTGLFFVGASLLAMLLLGALIASKLAPTFLLFREQLQLPADQHQLAMRIAPLAQAQIVQEVLPAPTAQCIGAQRLALLLEAAPEVDQRGEV
ncbi:hypothetical protein D3C76_1295770 [compost metagenome]